MVVAGLAALTVGDSTGAAARSGKHGAKRIDCESSPRQGTPIAARISNESLSS